MKEAAVNYTRNITDILPEIEINVPIFCEKWIVIVVTEK